MKKLHLICNSHIDPVWMWDWEEGLGESISTFHQAEEFFRDFDYIFNHNESILYEFIEKKDPELFARIKARVESGDWHIMGGWYLQPDCNIPSGEAFVRQIGLGRRYFQEKFGKRPTTAINFDSFGHTVGLVQILKKCGFDSYLFCRPMPEMLELPARQFLWVGKDGSKIKATRCEDESIYCSGFGTALVDIQRKASVYDTEDVGVALWGVGNHGGLPSRKDLEDVTRYMREAGFEVIHSTPEEYFGEIEPTAEFAGSLQPCLIGAYTAMQSIKQKHIELENKLFTTEKLCALAELNGLYTKDEAVFERVERHWHPWNSTISPPAPAPRMEKRAACARQTLRWSCYRRNLTRRSLPSAPSIPRRAAGNSQCSSSILSPMPGKRSAKRSTLCPRP